MFVQIIFKNLWFFDTDHINVYKNQKFVFTAPNPGAGLLGLSPHHLGLCFQYYVVCQHSLPIFQRARNVVLTSVLRNDVDSASYTCRDVTWDCMNWKEIICFIDFVDHTYLAHAAKRPSDKLAQFMSCKSYKYCTAPSIGGGDGSNSALAKC